MSEEEFTQLYDRYADTVYRLSLFIVGQKEDAEDIVQQTFTKLYQHAPIFAEEAQRKAWLLKTAKNASYDLLKCAERKKRFWETEEEALDNRKQQVYREPESVLSGETAILEEISDKYRLPLYLFYYEEYSTGEIADILKLSETAVRSRLSRGRKQLEKKIVGKVHEKDRGKRA